MDHREYQARRANVFSNMKDESIALLYSGVAKIASEDENHPFVVNKNFYYLTGIEQEDCVLMLVKNQGERKEYLFIPPFDPVKEKWYGHRLSPEEPGKIAGIRNVLMANALEARIHAELNGSYSDFGTIDKAYIDLSPELKVAENTFTTDVRSTIERAFPAVEVFDARPLVHALRKVKSPAEIAAIKAAIATTRLGIMAVMAKAKSGIREYELANEFFHVINDDNENNGLAFSSIVAGGARACTLHYPNPQATIRPGELVLCDLGARHEYYCGDISRTFPASKTFSEQQKLIYSIVLGANKAVANFARPGLTLKELNNFTKEYLASECFEKGLIKSKDDIGRFYYHNVSHHIGLDTHDPGDREEPLQEGNVISDEPGLYFAELGIGVRIEDDLLITKNGAEVLSKDIIKEIDEIETFLGSGARK